MALFSRKTIQRSKTLGERLRKVRQEAGYSLADVERATQIRSTYLQAIEEGNYSSLPGTIYIESFLKKYASFLQVSVDYVLDLYRRQERRVLPKQQPVSFLTKTQQQPRPSITPQRIRLLVISLVIIAGLGYIGFVVAKIFSPPPLTVASPADSIMVNERTLELRGTTVPEAALTINGQEVFLDSTGSFNEQVTLTEGVNVITIRAEKKRGKPTVVTRTIRYQPAVPPTN